MQCLLKRSTLLLNNRLLRVCRLIVRCIPVRETVAILALVTSSAAFSNEIVIEDVESKLLDECLVRAIYEPQPKGSNVPKQPLFLLKPAFGKAASSRSSRSNHHTHIPINSNGAFVQKPDELTQLSISTMEADLRSVVFNSSTQPQWDNRASYFLESNARWLGNGAWGWQVLSKLNSSEQNARSKETALAA